MRETTDGTAAVVGFHGEVGKGITTASFGCDAAGFSIAENLEGSLATRGGLEGSLPLVDGFVGTGKVLVAIFVKQG